MSEKEKPRIFIFSIAYFPLVGGAEVAVRELTERLRDFSFFLITPRIRFGLPRREVMGNIELFRVGFGFGMIDKLLFPWWGKWKAERLHRRAPADIIWAIMASYAGFAALFFKRAHPEIPLLLTLQEGDSEAHILRRAWMTWSWFTSLFEEADTVQTISHYLARFAKKYGFPGEPRVIPNGVPYREFASPQHSREALRRAHSTPQDAPLVITVSRLVPKNGVGDLIAAMRELPTSYLWIVGSGPLVRKLQATSDKRQVRDRVRFLGEIPHAELPKYLQAADVFCRPSHSEGLGNAFLEAMAAGLPIVGTNVGGIPDFLKDGETGLFANVGDPRNIAEKITRIIADPVLAETLRRNGRKLVEERYDWGRIAEEFRELFERLLETPSRVLIAGEIYPPEIGGPAVYTKAIFEGLRARTTQAALVTHTELKNPKSEIRNPKQIPNLKFKILKFLRYFRYAFRLLRSSTRASVLYAQGPIASGLPSHLVSFLMGRPYVVKVTGDYAWEQARQNFAGQNFGGQARAFGGTIEEFQSARVSGKIALLKMIERHVVRSARQVIVPSNYVKRIVEGWGVPRERIEVIYNVVEPVGDEMARAAEAPKGKIILSAGRMVPWKGFDTLISLMPELKKEFPDLHLIIAGDGPLEPELKAISYKLKADSFVKFLGRIPQKELWQWIRAADLFVLYSGYEGLSHQLIEVMQLGTPVIASNAGGNPELITDGVSGRLVSYGNRDRLREAVIELLRNPDEGERLARNAKDFIAQFSEEWMTRETFRVLKEVGI